MYRRGHLTAIHHWFSKRPSSFITYINMPCITHQPSFHCSFLHKLDHRGWEALCRIVVSTAGKKKINAWLYFLRENKLKQKTSNNHRSKCTIDDWGRLIDSLVRQTCSSRAWPLDQREQSDSCKCWVAFWKKKAPEKRSQNDENLSHAEIFWFRNSFFLPYIKGLLHACRCHCDTDQSWRGRRQMRERGGCVGGLGGGVGWLSEFLLNLTWQMPNLQEMASEDKKKSVCVGGVRLIDKHLSVSSRTKAVM